MARKLRIAAFCTLGVAVCLLMVLGGAYYAAQQVRPFYEQALHIEPEVLERGSRELESRATALYSDARQAGQWQAVFTAEQINGWLAVQLVDNLDVELPSRIRDPRVAISPDMVTLGFRTSSGGVETVVSVDAGVFLTEEGAVAIRFDVGAGRRVAVARHAIGRRNCRCMPELCHCPCAGHGKTANLWRLSSLTATVNRAAKFHIDEIKLRDGELYVAGHTELTDRGNVASGKSASGPASECTDVALDEFELRLTPHDNRSALEVARRPAEKPANNSDSADR